MAASSHSGSLLSSGDASDNNSITSACGLKTKKTLFGSIHQGRRKMVIAPKEAKWRRRIARKEEWQKLTDEIVFPSVLENLDVGRNLFTCPCLPGLLEDVRSNQLIPA